MEDRIQQLESESKEVRKEYHEIKTELVGIKHEIASVAKIIQRIPDFIRLDQRVEQIESKLVDFVTSSEFKPVRLFVYGCIGIVLTAVGGAVIALVLK